jgi:hypothetical protein
LWKSEKVLQQGSFMHSAHLTTTTMRLGFPAILALLIGQGAESALWAGPVTYDVHYTMTREWDPATNQYETVYDNLSERDSSGNFLHTSAIPVFAREGADQWKAIWVEPGYSLTVGHDGTAKKHKDPFNGDNNPPDPNRVSYFPKHNFNSTTTVLKNQGNVQYILAPNGPLTPLPAVGTQLPKGCYSFFGIGVVSFSVDGPLSTVSGDGSSFGGLFLVNGPASTPALNSVVPGIFDDRFDTSSFWYVGDYNLGSGLSGSGFGTIDIQCNNNSFMSAVTPEAYVGCVPEPSSFLVLGCLAIAVAVLQWFRRRVPGTSRSPTAA